MTVYYATIALVLYFSILAQATGRLPSYDPQSTRTLTRPYFLFVAFAGITLALVNGLRWRVGTDYGAYALNYRPYAETFFSELRPLSEPGIKAIAYLSSHIRDDYATMMLLSALIIVSLNVWTIAKNSDSIVLGLMLYIFAGPWHGSFNGIRQHLAVAVIFAGHRLIIERRFWRYLIVVALASLFHISALAFVLLYFVPRTRLNPRAVALLLAASAVALYSTDAVITAIETATSDDFADQPYVSSEVSLFRTAVAVAPTLLYFFGSRAMDASESQSFYRNMVLVHGAVMVAVSGSTYLARFGIFTTAFLPLAIPLIVKFDDRQITLIARVLALILFFTYWYNAVSPSDSLNQFRWIFQRDQSYL